MPKGKKLAASFSQLKKCKDCNKGLDKNSSDEILRLGLCPDCHKIYQELETLLKWYLKNPDKNIDEDFDRSAGALVHEYDVTRNFEPILLSGVVYRDSILSSLYCCMDSSSSSPSSGSTEERGGSPASSGSDSPHEEERVLKAQREREQMERQKELFERLERENAEKIASFLAKNKGFRDYCANHFDRGTSGEEKIAAENSMILHLLKLREARWKGGQPFYNLGNPLKLNKEELSKIKLNQYACTEYYAERGRQEGLFRFVVLIDTVKGQPIRIYFTSTHYEKFIELNM